MIKILCRKRQVYRKLLKVTRKLEIKVLASNYKQFKTVHFNLTARKKKPWLKQGELGIEINLYIREITKAQFHTYFLPFLIQSNINSIKLKFIERKILYCEKYGNYSCARLDLHRLCEREVEINGDKNGYFLTYELKFESACSRVPYILRKKLVKRPLWFLISYPIERCIQIIRE